MVRRERATATPEGDAGAALVYAGEGVPRHSRDTALCLRGCWLDCAGVLIVRENMLPSPERLAGASATRDKQRERERVREGERLREGGVHRSK